MHKQIILVLLLLFLLPNTTQAASFTAKVISVHDGDSLTVIHNNKNTKIRLQGIDCPELAQAYGKKAGQAASKLANGKTVNIKVVGKDKYGRTLADIIFTDGRNLNHELVRQGYAWWFRRYSDDRTLAKLEVEARKAKRGLWAQKNPLPPWEWRKQHRKKVAQPAAEIKVIPNGVEIIALLPNPKGTDKGNEKVVIANRNKAAINLKKWELQDRAGNIFRLSGKVPKNGRLVVTMTEPSMPLNNDGDEVLLKDSKDVARNKVAYGKADVQSGKWIEFRVIKKGNN